MRPSFPFSPMTVHNGRETSCPETGWGLLRTGPEVPAMFGIAAIVAFVVALILQLASVSKGVFLTVETFTLIGLLCLAVHVVTGWLPWKRSA